MTQYDQEVYAAVFKMRWFFAAIFAQDGTINYGRLIATFK